MICCLPLAELISLSFIWWMNYLLQDILLNIDDVQFVLTGSLILYAKLETVILVFGQLEIFLKESTPITRASISADIVIIDVPKYVCNLYSIDWKKKFRNNMYVDAIRKQCSVQYRCICFRNFTDTISSILQSGDLAVLPTWPHLLCLVCLRSFRSF